MANLAVNASTVESLNSNSRFHSTGTRLFAALLLLVGWSLVFGYNHDNLELQFPLQKRSGTMTSKPASRAVNTTAPAAANATTTSQATKSTEIPQCIWSPKLNSKYSSYAGTSCMKILTQAILHGTRTGEANDSTPPNRWLFFGDSTVFRLWKDKVRPYFANTQRISNKCQGIYHCEYRINPRCGLAEAFGLPPAQQDLPPNTTLGEGPAVYGLENPGCQDCSGCRSGYTFCKRKNSTNITTPETCRKNLYSGSYFSIEFSRDVEVQSQLYNTTQENVAAFLEQQRAEFDSEDPLPVCLISMGLHDQMVAGYSVELFGENMLWFLRILDTQCSHIIWLPNASPVQVQRDPMPQSRKSVGKLNDHIASVTLPAFGKLASTPTSILNVWDASIGYPHANNNRDNIHLDPAWYQALGSFVIELFKNVVDPNTTVAA